MSTFWLAADEKYFSDYFDFSVTDGTTIPVVTLQTGSSRSAMYPGVYREPRVRTYSDKIAAPTAWNVPKNITFSALIYGASMDEIYAKFQKIESLLDRAQIFSSPFSRGTGVVFLEQLNDAQEFTCWDVISGVLTDVDMNLPGVDWVGAIVQLVVSPYSRGTPQVLPYGSTITNGVNGKLYIPNVLGDAPGIFEFRLTDVSDTGNYITWVTVGRRWYPQMASTDFTPIYAEASSITTSAVWQQILAQSSAAGKHQTGLFDVYAMVNDASPVIGPVTSFTAVAGVPGSGLLGSGTATVVLVPRDANGNAGPPSAAIQVPITTLAGSGGVPVVMQLLAQYNFASGQWPPEWVGTPNSYVIGAGSAAITLDATLPMSGAYSAHFKTVGNTTVGSVNFASESLALPPLPTSKILEVQFLLAAKSWSAPVTVAVPGAPTSLSGAAAGATYLVAGTYTVGLTWVTPAGETSIGATATVTILATQAIYFTTPTPPAGVTKVGVYISQVAGSSTLAWSVYVAISPNTPLSTSAGYTGYPTVGAPPPAANRSNLDILPRISYGGIGIYQTGVAGTFAAYLAGGQTGPGVCSNLMLGTFTLSTPSTDVNGVQTLPTASILVDSTTGYAAAGAIVVVNNVGQGQVVNYTSVDATHFLGCTGGTGTLADEALIYQAHTIEFNWDASASVVGSSTTTPVYQRLYVDGVTIGGGSFPVTNPLQTPALATFQTSAYGQAVAQTEEFWIGQVFLTDQFMGSTGGLTSIAGGSSIVITGTPGLNSVATDLYYSFAGNVSWYKVPSISLPMSLTNQFPNGVQIVSSPPNAPLAIAYAQIRARLGAGSAPVRFQPASVVRTKRANGTDEMVKLGTLTLPPGSKGEYRDLDGWTLALDGKSGATNANLLTVKGLYLFPADEEGVSGFTAKALGLTQTCEWRIGWNRFGRPYAMLFATSGGAFLGYADVTGGLAIMPGDNQFVVLVQKDDGAGNLVADNVHLKYQLGAEWTFRQHFEATMIPVS